MAIARPYLAEEDAIIFPLVRAGKVPSEIRVALGKQGFFRSTKSVATRCNKLMGRGRKVDLRARRKRDDAKWDERMAMNLDPEGKPNPIYRKVA